MPTLIPVEEPYTEAEKAELLRSLHTKGYCEHQSHRPPPHCCLSL